MNKLRAGVKVCAVKAPGFGDNRKANLAVSAQWQGGAAGWSAAWGQAAALAHLSQMMCVAPVEHGLAAGAASVPTWSG